jgi:antibiotic biosynthesis monooxygenase (ABM) superfamily enzyme
MHCFLSEAERTHNLGLACTVLVGHLRYRYGKRHNSISLLSTNLISILISLLNMQRYGKMGGEGDLEMGTGGGDKERGHVEYISPLTAHIAPVDTYKPETYDSVVYIIVPIEKLVFFQTWLVDVLDTVSTFKGFMTRYVHEVEKGDGYIQFMVITVFDSFPSFNNWYASDKRLDKNKSLNSMGITCSGLNSYGGSGAATDAGSTKLHRIVDQSTALKVPKPRAPPKWKLTLVVMMTIYVIVVAYVYSGQATAMLMAGLPKGFVVFIYVCELVLINVFALSRIVTEIPWIDMWLRMPRADVENMHQIHAVLDQGLMIFALKVAQPISPEMLQWMDKIEGKVTSLRRVEHELREQIARLENIHTQGDADFNAVKGRGLSEINSALDHYADKSGFAYQGEQPKRISMAVRHFVKWEYVLEFESWTDDIENEMRHWAGFLGMVKISPRKDGDPYIISFSFDTAEHILAFSKSERRKELLLRLPVMLEATSQAEINEERTISDGFSELFVATGGSAKRRPPPLWKTCILTIIPLHLIVWQAGGALDQYLIPTGMSIYASVLIKLVINITFNSYIGVPLMVLLFGDWLHIPRPIHGVSYMRFLDRGLLKPVRYAVVVVYMFVCILAGLLSS